MRNLITTPGFDRNNGDEVEIHQFRFGQALLPEVQLAGEVYGGLHLQHQLGPGGVHEKDCLTQAGEQRSKR